MFFFVLIVFCVIKKEDLNGDYLKKYDLLVLIIIFMVGEWFDLLILEWV